MRKSFENVRIYLRACDIQTRELTVKSPFVEGKKCAERRWVKDLDIYFGSKYPNKRVLIPADIHKRLAFIGNHLRSFASLYPISQNRLGANYLRNILVSHVSFIVSRDNQTSSSRHFIEGGYLNFEENDPNGATIFVSGPNRITPDAIYQYASFRYLYNNVTVQANPYAPLPLARVMGGNDVESVTGMPYSDLGYEYHTEEWFYEMLAARPRAVVSLAEKVLRRGDKIKSVIFDLYSWWDVCQSCQDRFRTEYFDGKVADALKQSFELAGFRSSKLHGVCPIFRISSFKRYVTSQCPTTSLVDMTYAGGGSHLQGGFDARIINQSQVILCTRSNGIENNYGATYNYCSRFIGKEN